MTTEPEPQLDPTVPQSQPTARCNPRLLILSLSLFIGGIVLGMFIQKNILPSSPIGQSENIEPPVIRMSPTIVEPTSIEVPETSPTPDIGVQSQARKITPTVPVGWTRITDTSQFFEIAFDPQVYRESSTADKRVDIVQIIDPAQYRYPISIHLRVLPYSGGSRHLFIYKWANGGLDTTKSPFDESPNTSEENLIFNGRSCLMIENAFISMSQPTWLMCDIGSGQAVFINSTTDMAIKTLQTFSLL